MKTALISLLFSLLASTSSAAIKTIMEGVPASNNTILISTANTRVGLGTTSPATLLDVNGASQFGSGVSKSTFTSTGNLILVAGSTISANGTLSISTGPSVSGTGVPSLFLARNGNIGIGTVSPAANSILSILRNVTATLTSSLSNQQSDGAASQSVISNGETILLNAYGTAAAGTTDGISNNSLALLNFGSPTNTVIGVENSSPLIFTTSAAEKMRLSGAGNLGINTTSPQALLDVNGASQFGSGVNKSTFAAAGSLSMAYGITATTGVFTTSVTVQGNSFSVGTTALAVTSGRVGIGTASPLEILHVNGADGLVVKIQSASGNTLDIQKFSTRVDYNDAGVKNIVSFDLSNGRFGVATTAPQTTMDVSGTSQFGSGVNKSTITINGFWRAPSWTTAQLNIGGAAPTPGANGEQVFNSTLKDMCVSTGTASGNWALVGSKGATGCF